MYVCIYIYIYIYVYMFYAFVGGGLLPRGQAAPGTLPLMRGRRVDFRNFIVFLGRDPGTLKSDIVSKKHPQ